MRKTILILAVAAASAVGIAACGTNDSSNSDGLYDDTQTTRASDSYDYSTPTYPTPSTTTYHPTTNYPTSSSSSWTPALEEYAWEIFNRASGGMFSDRRCVLDVIESHFPDPLDLTSVAPSEIQTVALDIAVECHG